MAKVAVVFHSGYGHTLRVAQSAAEGAGADLVPIDADGNLTDAQWASLDAADALIFGSPTYMGSPSWQFKKFADASSKRWYTRAWKGKVAGGFTCSANLTGDKGNTMQSLWTLAMQHGMVWAGLPMLNDGHLNRLGAYGGAMAQCGPTDPADKIPQGDLDTAAAYGKHIAELAAKLAV